MLSSTINAITGVTLFTSSIASYLNVNKMWSRKHERPVAESISVAAMIIAITINVPFFIKFAFIDGMAIPAARHAMGLGEAFFLVAVGSGVWVRGGAGKGFFRLLASALRLERRESADLVKAFLQPPFKREIMRILSGLVTLDKNVDETELKLIQEFARQWKIEVSDFSAGPRADGASILDVRNSVITYLACQPDTEQASQLEDIMRLVGNADGEVTSEEAIVLQEIQGMIESYVGGNSTTANFEVLLVPQNEEQIDAVRTLLPDASIVERRGGSVFLIDRFYSEEYAESVCRKYAILGIFAITVSVAK